MKKHIICLGDSNTHGYCADPEDCADPALARFNEDERWTCLLQRALGEEFQVYEEGLSGRTTVFSDPLYEGLDALGYLWPCLKSHEPVGLLIIMLGTNDTKERFNMNAFAISLGMRRLVQKAQTTDCWGPGGRPNILIIAPPAIGEGVLTSPVAEEMGTMGPGCVEKSRKLPAHLRRVAEETGCHFLDANELDISFNTIDFMHLTRRSHARLAEVLGELVPRLLAE